MTITKEKLQEILCLHKMWLNGNKKGNRANLQEADLREADLREADLQEADLREADLRGANLRGADLRGANLQEADLQEADLQEANLRGADLRGANLQEANLREANLRGADLREADLCETDIDYACWPLWCGSLDVKVDRRIAAQLAYHFCRLNCDDPDYINARNALVPFANSFHRVEECWKLEKKEAPTK